MNQERATSGPPPGVEEILRQVEGERPGPLTRLPREALDREERGVKSTILRMGGLVEDQIRAAIKALVKHDQEAALAVILGDSAVNDAQREISGLIISTIATQQPVARDLRLLLVLDHVSYELERIGDHASSVAKVARKLAPEPPLKRYIHLPRMAEIDAAQVNAIVRALIDLDVAAAREVARRDDEIDALYHETFSECVDLMRADPANVERGTHIVIASHYLERIGDRVTNIAEDIVFLATGQVEDLNP